MGEEPNVGFMERVRGYFRSKAIRPSDKVDRFIIGNLPEYVEEYKLAHRSDLKGVDKRIEESLKEVRDMEIWKESTEERLEEARRKVERMEKLHGTDKEAKP